jgi:hypothetical protein
MLYSSFHASEFHPDVAHCSEIDSLEGILSAVRENESPPVLIDGTKLRVIINLHSDLNSQHQNITVQHAFNLNELLVEIDKFLQICGSATNIHNRHRKKWTLGPQAIVLTVCLAHSVKYLRFMIRASCRFHSLSESLNHYMSRQEGVEKII